MRSFFHLTLKRFGNVVLEALASGVPAIVTDRGGPQFIVRHGETGFIASDIAEFCRWIQYLAENPHRLQSMREAARADASRASWDAIFSAVYTAYNGKLQNDATVSGRFGLKPPRAIAPSLGQGRWQ